jgi:hypothetical protein
MQHKFKMQNARHTQHTMQHTCKLNATLTHTNAKYMQHTCKHIVPHGQSKMFPHLFRKRTYIRCFQLSTFCFFKDTILCLGGIWGAVQCKILTPGRAAAEQTQQQSSSRAAAEAEQQSSSRADAEQSRRSSRAAAEQQQSRNRAAAKQQQKPSRSRAAAEAEQQQRAWRLPIEKLRNCDHKKTSTHT